MTRIAKVYDAIPGLDEGLLASDYAEIIGSDTDHVIGSIRQRSLLGVNFKGEWYVEAPPFYKEALNRINRARRARADEDRNEQKRQEQKERDEENRRSRAQADAPAIKDERHYGRVLGLCGQVTLEDVKKRYRELVAQYHPDKVNHLGPKLKQVAEEEMKEINAAYSFFKSRYGSD
jgi:hypothetical protein